MEQLSQTESAREQRARRALARHGYRLEKTPSRHWTRYYGAGYQIVRGNIVVDGCGSREFEMSLEDVEDRLDQFCLAG